ncbi:MAG TPA: DNA repair protein RecO [Gaiellaceae bacterium]|nr:DNA repair protein RecO [Gaiellaceae bacterium]
MARTVTTEAVVLRSLRFSEADRILHLYTADRGRVGAIAKGARKTRSRFGGRLEPLSHVELVLHEGRGELQTITGASLVRAHAAVRDDSRRSAVGLVGAEAVLRLFPEQERNERVFTALTRFLDLLDEANGTSPRADLDPLGLCFQLKLLWLAGYLPHVGSCAECGSSEPVVGYSPKAGGVVCATCATDARDLSSEGVAAIDALLRRPLAAASDLGMSERAARDALAVVSASYEFHGGFRLRTLSA